MPGYSASKAALNAFTLCLREQLKLTTVRVIEISPPPVQSTYGLTKPSGILHADSLLAELHDYMGVDIGRKLGMPLDTFTERAYQKLAEGKDQIVIGHIGPADTFNKIIEQRRAAFENLAKLMRG
jgi:short-subunit dehydrogenase